MIQREATKRLKELAQTFPVVTIEGPRQSGKTTLAKAVFPSFAYVNLEDRVVRELAERDERAFMEEYQPPVIIDEIQRVPSLLSAIQLEVDRRGKNGLYILTGSHQPQLKAGISQTLAGRTALVTLLPLSIRELEHAGLRQQRDEYIFRGFMPAIYDRNQNPNDAYESYYRTYVERDVRQLVNLTHQREFELFVRLLAGRIGQVVNLSGMSDEIGISANTLKEWLNVLEAGFVVFRLQPYYNNFGKRFVKSPKIYFTDVGLAAHLLEITSVEQIFRDPLAGGLFENMVVVEALKAQLNSGKRPSLYYMRGKSGMEIDLIVEHGRELNAIEIKSAQTPDIGFFRNILHFAKTTVPVKSISAIYSGSAFTGFEGGKFVNFAQTADLIDSYSQI